MVNRELEDRILQFPKHDIRSLQRSAWVFMQIGSVMLYPEDPEKSSAFRDAHLFKGVQQLISIESPADDEQEFWGKHGREIAKITSLGNDHWEGIINRVNKARKSNSNWAPAFGRGVMSGLIFQFLITEGPLTLRTIK
jgi:hypothetical protein